MDFKKKFILSLCTNSDLFISTHLKKAIFTVTINNIYIKSMWVLIKVNQLKKL